MEKSNLLKKVKDIGLEVLILARSFETSNTKMDEFQLHSESVIGIGASLNDNKCKQIEVQCSLNNIDNGQWSNHECFQLRRGFARQDNLPIHDSSAKGVSCNHVEGHSDMNVLGIFGDEDNA